MTDDDKLRLTRDATALRDNPVFDELFAVARERVVRDLEAAEDINREAELIAELKAIRRVRQAVGLLIAPGEQVSRNRNLKV